MLDLAVSNPDICVFVKQNQIKQQTDTFYQWQKTHWVQEKETEGNLGESGAIAGMASDPQGD